VRRGGARLRERLLVLFAALALALGPIAARAHAYAAASLGADVCTTTDGKSPAPGGVHAEHCQCCNGTPLGPPRADAIGSPLSFETPAAAARADAVRVARIAGARPRGPPAQATATH